MKITVTSRRFKAPQSLVDYTKKALQKLERFYDGIIKADVILSYEKSTNSVKAAEVKIVVYGKVLTAFMRSHDFKESVDRAIEKVLARLKKYKDKLHMKNRTRVRAVKAKG